MSQRDSFKVAGVGCWCPGEMTLRQARLAGHTILCTEARRGWEQNNRHLSEIARQRAADEEAGRQLREAALEALGE